MKHQRKIIVGLTGIALVAVAIALVLQPRQPIYQGKPLRYWIDQLQQANAAQAEIAIRNIGPQATPWLVDRINAGEPLWRRTYRVLIEKVPRPTQSWFKPPPHFDDQMLWRVIGEFGPEARVATPQFMKLLDNKNAVTKSEAAFALWRITADPKYVELLVQWLPKSDLVFRLSWDGAEAVQRLELALNSSNALVREMAVRGLAFIGEKADPAAPSLAKLLKDPDGTVRLATVACLRQIGPNRRQAVAALNEALHDNASDDDFKEGAAEVLGMIGAEARAAESALSALMNDTNCRPATRERAATAFSLVSGAPGGLQVLLTELEQCQHRWANASFKTDAETATRDSSETLATTVRLLNRVRDLGASARPAARWLLDFIRSLSLTNSDAAMSPKLLNEAIDAVAAVGVDPSEEVPAMAQLLSDPSPDVRLKAAIELVRLGPEAERAVPALVVALQESGPGLSQGSTAHYLTLCAAEALGKIGPAARIATPELQRLLLHTNPEVRLEASVALWRITDPSSLLARALQQFESTSDTKAQIRLVELLGEIGPDATQAVPVILRRLTYLPGPVRAALLKIDPEALGQQRQPRK